MPRILCIDGGGIRGVVPAIVLAELEQRTGRAVSDCFDLLAGTSTGGIIALALTRPDPRGRPQYSAADLVGFYERIGPTIFARSPMHRARSLESLAGPRFESAPLRRALDEYFGDSMLSEALRDVLVTSYDIERREPFFFKSHLARGSGERDFAMRDVAAATSAGPTYFEPVRLETTDHVGYRALVDGGVFANNPTMCAWVEALRLYGAAAAPLPLPLPPLAVGGATVEVGAGDRIEATVDPARVGPLRAETSRADTSRVDTSRAETSGVDTSRAKPARDPATPDWLVLSLGTGTSDRRIPYAKARGWGLASWATSIIDIVFDGVSDTVDYQMRQLLPDSPGSPVRYCRLQAELNDASGDLGDATPANVRRLEAVAARLLRDNRAALERVVARLR